MTKACVRERFFFFFHVTIRGNGGSKRGKRNVENREDEGSWKSRRRRTIDCSAEGRSRKPLSEVQRTRPTIMEERKNGSVGFFSRKAGSTTVAAPRNR